MNAARHGNCRPSTRARVRPDSGFTLIELMIAMVVLAVLMAIAYPAYTGQVAKARRADAQATLLELTQFMERTYTQCNGYTQAAPACTAAVALPFTQTPKDAGTKHYNLSFVAGSVAATTYTLQAVPIGTHSGDSCGTMTVNQLSVKTAARTDCWR